MTATRRLNITNGGSAAGTLSEAGVEGTIVSWNDVLHEGPVDSSLSLEEMSRQRARFIAERRWDDFAHVSGDFAERDRVLQHLDYFDEVVLWFEDDLYDQLQLIQLLDFLSRGTARRKTLSLIQVDGYIPPLSAPRVKELAAFNKDIGMCAMYHTHSGAGRVGASQWDLWMLLRDLDKKYVSFNFDIAHATIEGGLGGWLHSTKLAMPHMGGIALKDFKWGRGGNRKWGVDWCPIGEGMVQTREFLKMARAGGFAGPAQVHYEYDLGGADKGLTKITMPKAQVLAAMKRDLDLLRELSAEAGWV